MPDLASSFSKAIILPIYKFMGVHVIHISHEEDYEQWTVSWTKVLQKFVRDVVICSIGAQLDILPGAEKLDQCDSVREVQV